jgi:REP-associated tyrosine transposase
MLVKVRALPDIFGNWATFLARKPDPAAIEDIRKHTRTGRPLADENFIEKLEDLLNRKLAPQKGGRPQKGEN